MTDIQWGEPKDPTPIQWGAFSTERPDAILTQADDGLVSVTPGMEGAYQFASDREAFNQMLADANRGVGSLQTAYDQEMASMGVGGRMLNRTVGQLGGSFKRTAQQVFGDFEAAQRTQRHIDMQQQAMDKAGGTLENLIGSVAGSLTKVAYMAPAGLPGIIGTFVSDAYNSRKVEALDRGFTEWEATIQGLIAGGVEGGITALFSAAGAGGLEQGFRRGLTKELTKALPKQLLGEISEENAILITQTALDDATLFQDFDSKNPEHWKNLGKQVAFTTAASAMGAAAATAARSKKQVREALSDPVSVTAEKVLEFIESPDARTRKNAADIGVHKAAPDKKSRDALAERAKEELEAHLAVNAPDSEISSPGEAVSQPPSPEQVSPVESAPNALDGVSEPVVESPPEGGVETAPVEPEAPQDVVEETEEEPLEAPYDPEADYQPDDETLMSPRREITDRVQREILGQSTYDSPAQRRLADVLMSAKEQGLNDPAKVNEIVERGPQDITPEERAGLTLRAGEIILEHREIAEELRSGRSTQEDIDAAHVAALENELEKVTNTLNARGSQAGFDLVMQKLSIDKNMDLASVMVRAKAAKGSDLSDSQRRGIEKEVEGLDAAEANLTNAMNKQKDSVAFDALNASKTKAPTPDQYGAVKDALKKLFDGGCHLG